MYWNIVGLSDFPWNGLSMSLDCLKCSERSRIPLLWDSDVIDQFEPKNPWIRTHRSGSQE